MGSLAIDGVPPKKLDKNLDKTDPKYQTRPDIWDDDFHSVTKANFHDVSQLPPLIQFLDLFSFFPLTIYFSTTLLSTRPDRHGLYDYQLLYLIVLYICWCWF